MQVSIIIIWFRAARNKPDLVAGHSGPVLIVACCVCVRVIASFFFLLIIFL
jgi:hypothetical protein